MKSLALQREKKSPPRLLVKIGIHFILLAMTVLSLAGCGGQSDTTSKAANATVQKLAKEPASGILGQLYFNTSENREFIYNGSEWVPHDESIDTYVPKKRVASPTNPLDYCTDSNGNDVCPDPMHRKHLTVMNNCQGCHDLTRSFYVPDSFFKNPLSAAFLSPTTTTPPVYTASSNWSSPAPATPYLATCKNIACHSTGVGNGEPTQYYFRGGDGLPELKTVIYGASTTVNTSVKSWSDVNLGGGVETGNCDTCHGNPPSRGVYHSGMHATGPNLNFPGSNGCQFCHPDAESVQVTDGNGQLVWQNQITNSNLHMNGERNIVARFTNRCFSCH